MSSTTRTGRTLGAAMVRPVSRPVAAYDPAGAFEDRAIRVIAAAGGTVVDAGGAARFTKGLERYVDLFDGVDYRTLDISEAARPDIVGDIHSLPFADGSVDAFLCRSVLEHVESPERAVAEMHRALKPGGHLLVSVPSVYPYHARTGEYGYPDNWRFLPDGLYALLRDFGHVELVRSGGIATAVVNFVPPLNARFDRLGQLARRIDAAMERRRPRNNSSFLFALARK